MPESIRFYIRYLEGRIQYLEAEVHELKARLSKDSSNSSKPPSSDGLKRRPKSLRKKSDKKAGGQQGRVGKGLAQVSNPDVIVIHVPSSYTECGALLPNILLPIEQAYSQILAKGLAYHESLPTLLKGKRGKQRQREGDGG